MATSLLSSKRKVIWLSTTFLLSSTLLSAQVVLKGVVSQVYDGDTIQIKQETGEIRKIRLLGIDTPETFYQGQNQGEHAENSKNYMKKILKENDAVTVELDEDSIDRYGRVLGHVFKGKEHINYLIALNGHAVNYVIAPNTLYADKISKAVHTAILKGRGIWNPENPLEEIPYLFRQRVSGRQMDKFVGDLEKKVYYNPQLIEKVSVWERIFFMNKNLAKKLGYEFSQIQSFGFEPLSDFSFDSGALIEE